MKTVHKGMARHVVLDELSQTLIVKLLIYDHPIVLPRKWGTN